jgi:hypothetical protein
MEGFLDGVFSFGMIYGFLQRKEWSYNKILRYSRYESVEKLEGKLRREGLDEVNSNRLAKKIIKLSEDSKFFFCLLR